MRKGQVARVFREIADLLEIQGSDGYKARAYRRAAHAIDHLSADVAELAAEGRLQEIPGVGGALAAKIEEILETGSCRQLQELRGRIPAGLPELLRLPGLGPRSVSTLYRQLGIESLRDLVEAARAGRLRFLPGFGEKKERSILESLERLEESEGRTPLAVALTMAHDITRQVQGLPGVENVVVAGSTRRHVEMVRDLDLVVASGDPEGVIAGIQRLPAVEAVLYSGDSHLSVEMAYSGFPSIRVDFLVTRPESFPTALHHFTGSRAHEARLRHRAAELGFKLEKHGLFDGNGRSLSAASEQEIYGILGLPWIPPELREDTGEIEAAEGGRLPSPLLKTDVRGDLHTHSTWSDGYAEIKELAEEGLRRGYEYLALTDHSRSLVIANGLDETRVRRQWEEIERQNRELDGIRLLKGIEVEILADGSLDFPDELLSLFDVVVASVHTGFRIDEDAMTERIIRAMENPHVDILGHPTGRLLGRRDPYSVNVERLISAAAATRTALEINASPDRLDLADRYARLAGEAGVMLAISTDAHSLPALDDMGLGLMVARRGWLEKASILNAMPLQKLIEYLGVCTGE